MVPAAGRKSAEKWDFEGPAICIPLISSAGHGKAQIKRIHYQEGRFALATTMCAAFVKNGTEDNPRHLHLWLSAACKEILVPLMRGATNVTLASERLGDVLVPVPERAVQDEVVESDLLQGPASAMLSAAKELRTTSTDPNVVALADRVTNDLAAILRPGASRANIQDSLPSPGPGAPGN